MGMFKKPGSPFGLQSQATPPGGGGGDDVSTIDPGTAPGTYLPEYGGWLVGYRSYYGRSHGVICDNVMSAGGSFATGAKATANDSWLGAGAYQSYDGRGNTYSMAAYSQQVSFSYPRAHEVAQLATGGFTDWYVPAQDEAVFIQAAKAALEANGYGPPGALSTCNQQASNTIVTVNWFTGAVGTIGKTVVFSTIPIRRVLVRT